jgi:ATP-dependent exoDNAse (exonuclease V) alpha subunit
MNQKKAIQLAIAGHNIFLTGNAGTGKTYTLNNIIQELRNRGKIVAVTASTGIASTHINGCTIHSWAGIGIKEKLTEEDLWKLRNNKFSYNRISIPDVLIIDEISMLHDYRFDMVNDVCTFVRGGYKKAFGGLQVIVVGDFFQLPPVNKNSDKKNYCFNAESWGQAKFKTCYLQKIYRQSDPVFIDILNNIRGNTANGKHHHELDALASNTKNRDLAVNLFCKNVNVDILNSSELVKLKTKSVISNMESDGLDFKVAMLKKNCLATETLILKEGAKVMVLVNDFIRGIVNGTLGEVVDTSGIDDGVIKIKVYRTEKVLDITRHKWKLEEYSEREGKDVEVASITQFPLKLAWALTIHKSQGATFDYINLDLRDTFADGMGYVALSRATSLDGIYLEGYNKNALCVDETVIQKDEKFLSESMENDLC